VYYLQHGEEEIATRPPKQPRAAAELEVRPGRSAEDQIAVVVSTLLDDQKSEALDSIKTIIQTAITEMRTWDEEAEARRLLMDDDDDEPIEEPPTHSTTITFPDDTLRTAVFKDGKLQLLLKLMGAERIGERRISPRRTNIDEPDATWLIPATTTTADLETNFRLLKQYIDEPPVFEDGKTAADLIRRKAAPKPLHEYTDDSSLSDSSASDSSGKPRKPTKKRKRRQLDDAEIEAQREKRRLADLEKRASIKSAAKIMDSDDDEDADREFFDRERELRERMERRALEGDVGGAGTRKAKKRKVPVQLKPIVDDGLSDVEILRDASEDGMRLDSEIREDSESGDGEGMKLLGKKRKFRRAVSTSSDED
jgi:replication fork protection complex subunit Tof1/Swi1